MTVSEMPSKKWPSTDMNQTITDIYFVPTSKVIFQQRCSVMIGFGGSQWISSGFRSLYEKKSGFNISMLSFFIIGTAEKPIISRMVVEFIIFLCPLAEWVGQIVPEI